MGITTNRVGPTRDTGNGSTNLMIYLVLASISSIAFATVTFKGENSSTPTPTLSQSQIKRVVLNESICLNPSYVSNSGNLNAVNYTVNDATNQQGQGRWLEKFEVAPQLELVPQFGKQLKVQLTSYPGSIRRFDDNTGITTQTAANLAPNLDKPNTLWNPLAKVWLTAEQMYIMKTAFDIAYRDGGLQHAKLIQGMLLQESLAGLLGRIGHMSAPVGKRSYGVMQVKVTAAKDVLGRHASLGEFSSDEELITHLIVDDAFNIRVASKHFLFLRAKTKTDDHALLAYNIGLRASRRYNNHKSFRYVKKVKRYTRQIAKPFNDKFNGKIISENQFVARKLKAS